MSLNALSGIGGVQTSTSRPRCPLADGSLNALSGIGGVQTLQSPVGFPSSPDSICPPLYSYSTSIPRFCQVRHGANAPLSGFLRTPPSGRPQIGPPEGGCSQPSARPRRRRVESTRHEFRPFRAFRVFRVFRAFQVVKVRHPVRLHPRHWIAPIAFSLLSSLQKLTAKNAKGAKIFIKTLLCVLCGLYDTASFSQWSHC